jgi:hypothetical protein
MNRIYPLGFKHDLYVDYIFQGKITNPFIKDYWFQGFHTLPGVGSLVGSHRKHFSKS